MIFDKITNKITWFDYVIVILENYLLYSHLIHSKLLLIILFFLLYGF